jgi:hypothetical protein
MRLTLWWFAVVSHGALLLVSSHHTESGCNITRQAYVHYHTVTTCQPHLTAGNVSADTLAGH